MSISYMSLGQIASLSSTIVSGWSTTELDSLSSSQIGAISTTAIAGTGGVLALLLRPTLESVLNRPTETGV